MSAPQSKLRVLSAVAAFVVASLLGYFVGRRAADLSRATAGPEKQSAAGELARLREQVENRNAVSVRQAEELAGLREVNRELSDQLRQSSEAARRQSADAAPEAKVDERARLRALVDMKKRRLGNVHLTFIERTGKLGKNFAELFSLTPSESQALQQAVDGVRKQLDAAASAGAKVSRGDGGSVVIEIPPAAVGANLYDALFESFAQTLGPERNAAFFELGAQQVEQALGSFGAEQRKLTIGRDRTSDGRQTFFTIRDDRITQGGSASSTSRLTDRAAVVEMLGGVGRLLPADF